MLPAGGPSGQHQVGAGRSGRQRGHRHGRVAGHQHHAIGDTQTEFPPPRVADGRMQHHPVGGLLGTFQPVAVDPAGGDST